MTNPARWEHASRSILKQLLEARYKAVEDRIMAKVKRGTCHPRDIREEFREANHEIDKILSIFAIQKKKYHWQVVFRGNKYIDPDKIIDPSN